MASAQRCQVARAGRALGIWRDVVQVAGTRGAVAVREDALQVPGADLRTQSVRDLVGAHRVVGGDVQHRLDLHLRAGAPPRDLLDACGGEGVLAPAHRLGTVQSRLGQVQHQQHVPPRPGRCGSRGPGAGLSLRPRRHGYLTAGEHAQRLGPANAQRLRRARLHHRRGQLSDRVLQVDGVGIVDQPVDAGQTDATGPEHPRIGTGIAQVDLHVPGILGVVASFILLVALAGIGIVGVAGAVRVVRTGLAQALLVTSQCRLHAPVDLSPGAGAEHAHQLGIHLRGGRCGQELGLLRHPQRPPQRHTAASAPVPDQRQPVTQLGDAADQPGRRDHRPAQRRSQVDEAQVGHQRRPVPGDGHRTRGDQPVGIPLHPARAQLVGSRERPRRRLRDAPGLGAAPVRLGRDLVLLHPLQQDLGSGQQPPVYPRLDHGHILEHAASAQAVPGDEGERLCDHGTSQAPTTDIPQDRRDFNENRPSVVELGWPRPQPAVDGWLGHRAWGAASGPPRLCCHESVRRNPVSRARDGGHARCGEQRRRAAIVERMFEQGVHRHRRRSPR